MQKKNKKIKQIIHKLKIHKKVVQISMIQNINLFLINYKIWICHFILKSILVNLQLICEKYQERIYFKQLQI